MLSVGDIIGSYRLEECLGAGGGGSVFRATHVLLGRPVAVKVLNDDLAEDDHFVSRFLHEAKIVNDIRHPNIIDIMDFLDLHEPRRVAYVMELLRGQPLNDVIRSKQVTPKQAIRAALQIVSALRAVHQTKVVHRDLKPANIFVLAPLDPEWSAVPSIKILDFGVAKISKPDVGHKTETGAIVGTPTYMAPEQIWAAPVSPATDIYAVGEIIYELLAGRCLFSGERGAVLASKVSGTTRAPFDLPGVADPRALEALIRECIHVEPSRRPSLDDLERALTKQLQGVSSGVPPAWAKTIARPASAPEGTRAERPRPKSPQPPAPPRWKRIAIAGAASFAVLAIGLVALPAFEPEPIAEPAPLAVEVAAAPMESPRPIPKRVELSSVPPGAFVIDLETNRRLGITPAMIPIDGDKRPVRLELPGHQPLVLPLEATGERIKVVLSREIAAPTKERRSKVVKAEPKVEEKEPARIAPLRKDEKTHW